MNGRIFAIKNDLLINKFDWLITSVLSLILRSTLTITLDGQTVELFPGATSVSVRGPLTLGKDKNTAGFGGCVRDIQDHGYALDVRRVLAASNNPGLTLGQCGETVHSCQANNPCEHGAKCRAGIAGLVCDCGETGYTGKTCHIPIYAATCTDLFLAGERRSGVHL